GPSDDPESHPRTSPVEAGRPDQVLRASRWQRGSPAEAFRFRVTWNAQGAAAVGHGRRDARGCGFRCQRGCCAPQAAMIGLDTNVLVRYLTQDDAVQSRKATE